MNKISGTIITLNNETQIVCATSNGRAHPVFAFWSLNLIDDLELFISKKNLGKKGKNSIKSNLIFLNKKNKYIRKVNLFGDKLITYKLK